MEKPNNIIVHLLHPAFLLTFVLVIMVTGCSSLDTERTDESSVEVVSAEQQTQNEIEILLELLESPRPRIAEVCRRLIEYGEIAVPELGRRIESRNPLVRVWSIYCLEQIYHNTKSSEIRRLEPKLVSRFNLENNSDVKLEMSTLLSALGNYRGVPILISALRHEKAYTRMVASQVLQDAFSLNFGYDCQAAPEVREQAVARWEDWWEKNRRQYLHDE